MKRILTINFSLIVLSAIMLVSCKAQKMTSDQLYPHTYEITDIEGKDVSDAKLTLQVNPETSIISGYAGCNRYSFNYKLEGKTLDLGFASATKMYCEDGMDNENLFFQKAASVTHFENSKEQIIFRNKDGDIVIKAKNTNQSE